jgi:hypothetical protein
MKPLFLGLLLVLVIITTAAAEQQDAAGHIQTLKGAASIQRGTATLPAAAGAPVYRGDTIRTGKGGSVGIVMSDDATFSLGPDSEIVLKEYLFNPKEGKFAFVTRMAKGTFAYLSGIISKLDPGAIRMEIPEATIAVRGTRLLIAVE